jgi:hypothetical protein
MATGSDSVKEKDAGWQDYSAPAQDWQDYSGPSTSTGIAAPQGTAGTGSTGKDILTGLAEGAANTTGNLVSGTARLINKIPVIGERLAPEQGIKALEGITAQRSEPQNPTQAIAKTGEQIGEWMIPSGGEEKAASMAPRFLSKYGPPLMRTGEAALESGLRNKSQGGEFGTGAEVGAGAGVLGEGMRAAAPSMAEGALGISKRMRGYGKTPGTAILEETSGIRPATIEKSAQNKLGQLTGDIERKALVHPGNISLRPALSTIDSEMAKAAAQNNEGAYRQLEKVRGSLTNKFDTGATIPADVPASDALDLKRGMRNQFITNWNPETMSGTRATAAKSSHAIDQELDKALGPQFASKNQRISSLIPVAERAESAQRGAELPERVFHRIGAHTGALAGTLGGGAYGYHQGGLPGMLKYGTAGLVLPEVLASPTTRMGIARGMYGSMLPRTIAGVALQADRP